MTLNNSIVLGNEGAAFDNVDDRFIVGVNNIVSGEAAAVFAQIDAATGGGAVADNGGPMATVALLADAANRALDAGSDALAPATDARGKARFDQPGFDNGGVSDIGAFERHYAVITNSAPVAVADEVTTSIVEPLQITIDPLPWLEMAEARPSGDLCN